VFQGEESGDGDQRGELRERGVQGGRSARRVFVEELAVFGAAAPPVHVRSVGVHGAGGVHVRAGGVRGVHARVLDLAVQPQTVPALGAVGAQVAGEGSLPGVHAHVFHQLIGRPCQVTAPVAPVLVALTMTLEVNQELLLPRKRPLADTAAMLGALGLHGNRNIAGGQTHTHTHTLYIVHYYYVLILDYILCYYYISIILWTIHSECVYVHVCVCVYVCVCVCVCVCV